MLVSDYSSHKKRRIGKIGGIVLEKGDGGGVGVGAVTQTQTSYWLTLSSVTFLWVFGVCLFCLFTPFLSVLFVFHKKNLVL